MSRDNGNIVRITVDPEKTTHRYSSLLTQEEVMSTFHIVDWNGSPGLKEWGYDNSSEVIPKKCLLIQGSFDGTIFQRKMRKERKLKLFRKAFCRPVQLEFLKEDTTNLGFKAYFYTLEKNIFASPAENPNNICYCHKGQCPGRGIQDIGACYYDIPIELSLPHFLNADPEVIKAIDGLSPDKKLHTSYATLQPDLGVPLDGSSLKIQVNLAVSQTKYNTRTKPFNGMTLPLFWIELTCGTLPDFVITLLRLIEIAPTIFNVVIYFLGLVGLSLICGALLLLLYFGNNIVPRHLSLVSDYSPLPVITINSEFLSKEFRRRSK